jgi:progressive ankylosis protein
MRHSLTFKMILLFFLPLILMQELHQISHSVIHAFLARLQNPKETIASFSISFAFVTTFSGISSVCIQACIGFVKDRDSFWHLTRFFSTVGLTVFFMIELIALTPLSHTLFGTWMGAGTEVVRHGQTASAIMGLWILPILARNLCYGLAMIHRRTVLITNATIVRLAALGVFLLLFPLWLEGAAAGGAALVGCMTVEAVYMLFVVRPFYRTLATDTGTPHSFYDIWKFSWPLMITQSSENGVAFIINFFLGQLSSPDLALAAFGIVYGLVRVILAPLRNLVQTAQTLLHTRTDLLTMLKFTSGLLLFFVLLIWGMFHTPLRIWILEGVMGLPLELSRYLTPAVKLIFLIAVFWGFAALFRGVLSAMRQTHFLAISAGLRLSVVTLIGSITFIDPHLNGAVVGVLAICGAFTAETLILGWKIRDRAKGVEPLFAS